MPHDIYDTGESVEVLWGSSWLSGVVQHVRPEGAAVRVGSNQWAFVPRAFMSQLLRRPEPKESAGRPAIYRGRIFSKGDERIEIMEADGYLGRWWIVRRWSVMSAHHTGASEMRMTEDQIYSEGWKLVEETR